VITEEVPMLFELRIYRTRPGQRASWVKFFEEELIPYMHSKGIVVVGCFVGEQDEDQFVWMRRFDSEEDRVRLYKAFYESEHWKNTLSPRVGELIDREQIQVIRLQPTPKSVLR
jgi:dTDP-4-dehydrorhamnose reductase